MYKTTKRRAQIFVVITLGIILLASKASAAVHYPDTVTHLHIPTWEDSDGHHQHRSNHQVMDWGTADGQYDANKVWTNENLNYVGNTSHGSHGFIEETNAKSPDFYFMGDWSATEAVLAHARVVSAFNTWSAITSDKPNLITGIRFDEIATLTGAEIAVWWDDGTLFPELKPDATGNVAAFFRPVLSAGSYDLVFDSSEDWYFGADKAGFLSSSEEWDFPTVALHEVGHVVGLTHQTDKDDIMYSDASGVAGHKDTVKLAGASFRSLSADDYSGARDLYSVPIPEPSTFIIWSLLGAVAITVGWRPRRHAA